MQFRNLGLKLQQCSKSLYHLIQSFCVQCIFRVHQTFKWTYMFCSIECSFAEEVSASGRRTGSQNIFSHEQNLFHKVMASNNHKRLGEEMAHKDFAILLDPASVVLATLWNRTVIVIMMKQKEKDLSSYWICLVTTTKLPKGCVRRWLAKTLLYFWIWLW